MNAEIVARLQGSFEISPPDRIVVDSVDGVKVYAPQDQLPSADEIAAKVTESLFRAFSLHDMGKETKAFQEKLSAQAQAKKRKA